MLNGAVAPTIPLLNNATAAQMGYVLAHHFLLEKAGPYHGIGDAASA